MPLASSGYFRSMVNIAWLGKGGAKGFELSLELSLLGKKALMMQEQGINEPISVVLNVGSGSEDASLML